MSNDKMLTISNSYISHCGINCWKELMERRGVLDYIYQKHILAPLSSDYRYHK
jgi:hypothetical protein